MRRLSKLPVFFDLADRRVVVAGGTPAAAWKAELLAAAGAHVDIYADTLSPEMAELIARGSHSGRFVHHARDCDDNDFANAALAVADMAGEAPAQAFYQAAQKADVPVNVIDKPAFCQFHFGAIVNRSPVVVAISTDGAAPILGQAIRRRIEMLLPPALCAWTALARTMRGAVTRRLAPAQRRAFWEGFVRRAFGSPVVPAANALDDLIDEIANDTAPGGGRVTLVGAGPGDAELLTVKAMRALQSADVILFDDLVSDDVLELARREAKRMLVGKRGKRQSCKQDDINALMIKLSRQGKHVVRLKSGDPMIFGRAGEEIAQLESAGIAVDVVPGITAALAMASAFGASLTHRDYAHSLRFVTGHSRNGELPADLDWRGLADPQTTTMFYMGGRTSSAIAQRLIDEGLSPGTPVAVVSAVSRREEARWFGTLAQLGAAQASIDLTQPVLIGVGRALAAAKASRQLNPPRVDQAHLAARRQGN
jgi:uroporphyrin-III C-methyltransferase/precorrin-2 dehydrogenase/sirohydrochlorin ferrochelatase